MMPFTCYRSQKTLYSSDSSVSFVLSLLAMCKSTASEENIKYCAFPIFSLLQLLKYTPL